VPDPRAALAVATSKLLTRGLRLSGGGGGTALPGLVASRVDPRLLDKLAERLPAGVIVVAGTNGKTTTSRMLAGVLSGAGRKVVHNRSGSNLVRGIAAAFAEQMSLLGSGDAEIGVIESDENAFPDVVRRVRPRMVVLLNLFRDQLDRYGELETIAFDWQPAVAALERDSVLVVNADDPNLAALACGSTARVVTFGLDDCGYTLAQLPHASDAGVCRFCESRLSYKRLYLSHLGDYQCPSCGWRRPNLGVSGSGIELDGVTGLRMQIDAHWPRNGARPFQVEVGVGGLYNAYNVLAAASAALALGVRPETIQNTLSAFQAAFGRLERVEYQGRTLTLALAKNPVGFNELLRMLTSTPRAAPLVVGINDLDADGRDVSWLWDVDFEMLAGEGQSSGVFAVGIRGSDLAVRLKYAGVGAQRLQVEYAGTPLADALDGIIAATEPGDEIFLLLTYTAMLELRGALAEQGVVAQFWEQ
jgi:UDP-N-acetylmuramyl tripeptide synthase